jgi:hypothetical protein
MVKITETAETSLTEITYRWEGDYLIPDIGIAEEEANLPSLTKWGLMRKNHLKNHRRIIYTDLKLSGKLFLHYHEIEEQAKNRMEFMMKQLTAHDPPPDKATDPIAWVRHMNGLKAQVEEIIKAELIYG